MATIMQFIPKQDTMVFEGPCEVSVGLSPGDVRGVASQGAGHPLILSGPIWVMFEGPKVI